VEKQRVYAESGSLVQEVENDYLYKIYQDDVLAMVIDLPETFGSHYQRYYVDGSDPLVPFNYGPYHAYYKRHRTKAFLQSTTTKTYGETGGQMESVSTFTYDLDNTNLLSKTDGVTGYDDVTTDYLYAADVGNQAMLFRDMTGVPVISKVSGLISKGSKTDYELLHVNGENYIFPTTFYQLATGSNDTWRQVGKIYNYNGAGFPLDYQKLTYPKEEYTWTGPGLLQQRKWTDERVWDYTYDEYYNLETSNDMMSINSSFEYDEFQRLKKSITRNGTQETDYEYKYQLTDEINSILAIGDYEGVDYNVNNFQVFDAFGRPISTLSRGYLASGVGYNALGAEKIISDANAGAAQEIHFDGSPLNRKN
ncbi:MAG: hypothetical protein AAGK97_17525, partial [Bacteroidota bacterium]